MRGGVGERGSPPRCRPRRSDATLAIPIPTAAVSWRPVPASFRQRKCSIRDVSEERYASVSRCTFSCRQGKKKITKIIKIAPFLRLQKLRFARGNEKKMGALVLSFFTPKVRNRGLFLRKRNGVGKWNNGTEIKHPQWGMWLIQYSRCSSPSSELILFFRKESAEQECGLAGVLI